MKNINLENAIIAKLRELSELVVAAGGSELLYAAIYPDGFVHAFQFEKGDELRCSFDFYKFKFQSWDEIYAERAMKREKEVEEDAEEDAEDEDDDELDIEYLKAEAEEKEYEREAGK